jgi:hypothetical protein
MDHGIMKLRQYLAACTTLTVLASSSTAIASQQTGTVSLLAVANSEAPKAVALSGPRTATPACATDGMWAFKDMSVLSVIISAKFNNKAITINGTGTCSAQHTNREEVSYITID